MGYEIVKPVKKKNPDGNIVYTYPSSEEFGRYGWFYIGEDKKLWERMKAHINSLLTRSAKFE